MIAFQSSALVIPEICLILEVLCGGTRGSNGKDGYEENDVKIKVSDDKEKRGLASKYHVANKKQ